MDAAFWHERWQRGEIGFHKASTNPLLQRWWPQLGVDAEAPVWVPLCGKSLDLIWLRSQGHPVRGVELARSALESFSDEHGLDLQWQTEGEFEVAEGAGFTLYCGDVFALRPEHLQGIGAIYDRAALIALPPEMRARYVAHQRALLPAGWRLLLVTLDYPQEQRPGPPFSVSDAEVRQLYAGCSIEVLEEKDVLADHKMFASQGMRSLTERVYLIAD